MNKFEQLVRNVRDIVLDLYEHEGPDEEVDSTEMDVERQFDDTTYQVALGVVPDSPTREWALGLIKAEPSLLDKYLGDLRHDVAESVQERLISDMADFPETVRQRRLASTNVQRPAG